MLTNWEKWIIAIFSTLQGIITILTFGSVNPRLSVYFYNKYAKLSAERWKQDRAKKLKICPECEFGYTTEKQWHRQYCTLQPHNQLINSMRVFQHNEAAFNIQRKRLREQVTFWQGKYQIVKQENNALRKHVQ